MNKLLGLVKLSLLIKKNKNRNMSLLNTDKDISIITKVVDDFGHMDFFDNYDELQQLIKDLKNNEKRIFLSMAREQTRENYFDFKYIKPIDMLAFIEKKDDRVKCTFKKMKLKRDNYEKRSRE